MLARDLQIPSNHGIITNKLLFGWGPAALPIIKDYFAYIVEGKRLGVFVWLATYILCIETVMSIRFSYDQLREVMPWQSKWILQGFALLWTYLLVIAFFNGRARKPNKVE